MIVAFPGHILTFFKKFIWAQMNSSVAANNIRPNCQSFDSLPEMHLSPVLPNNGGLFVGRHVKRVEDEYWTRNNLCESKIEKFVLGLKANHLFSYHEIYK